MKVHNKTKQGECSTLGNVKLFTGMIALAGLSHSLGYALTTAILFF